MKLIKCSYLTSARIVYVIIIALAAGSAANADRATQVVFDALVKVTCKIPGRGKLVSTGFLWPDNRTIVTALHGVAGCQPGKLSVKSEKTADTRFGEIANVNLEGDLAFVKLVNRSGVESPFPKSMVPLELSREEPQPKVVERYSISSYPAGGARNDDFLAFRGSTPFISSLGNAFSPNKKIIQLLKSQTYPKHSTQILRVGSILRQGQSGAPIVDPEGRLIAIADGGLDGGFVGLNWAVVAKNYITKLQTHFETPPGGMSKTAEAHLISALLPEDKKTVNVPSGVQGLEHVRRLPLTYLYDTLKEQVRNGDIDPYALDSFNQIFEFADEPSDYEGLSFDVYEDIQTGATIGVPSDLELHWNPELQALTALTALTAGDNKEMMIVAVRRYGSFEKAISEGTSEFMRNLPGRNWTDSSDGQPIDNFTLNIRDDEVKWANWAASYDGTIDQKAMNLSASVSILRNTLIGYATIYRIGEALSTAEILRIFMLNISLVRLTDFAVY